MAIADELRGKELDDYSVWLVFFDGEEAFEHWSACVLTHKSSNFLSYIILCVMKSALTYSRICAAQCLKEEVALKEMNV